MGIRVTGAGALTTLSTANCRSAAPIIVDFGRAEPLRELARELGETTASLAHR